MPSPWPIVGKFAVTVIAFVGAWALTSWLDGLGVPLPRLAAIWISCGVTLFFVWVRHDDRKALRRRAGTWVGAYTLVSFAVIAPIGVALVAVGMYAVMTPPEAPTVAATPEKPDVGLRFVGSVPALVIDNKSGVVVREIKWAVALFNLDSPVMQPLEIPVSTFDWLRPHSSGGPQGLFFRPAVAARVKKGDRVFGSASVSCPECTVGRTYALSFTYAIAGWFAELPDWKNADMLVPKMVTPDGLTAFYGFINSIPDNKRIQIPAR